MPVAKSSGPKDLAKRIIPQRPVRAAIVIVAFTAVLYAVEFVDITFFHLKLEGIIPRNVHGLLGVIWAPLLHDGWQHLFSNTIPIVVFGFLAMAGGIRQWAVITSVIWLVSGLGVWLTGAAGDTVGASGIAFGWLAFLLIRGLFNRSIGQILVALVLLFYWGSVLWGLIPGQPQISWQAHLFGAIAGIFTAWFCAARAVAKRRAAARPPAQLPGTLAA
jgi:membrane associated rhomboid family serine protease